MAEHRDLTKILKRREDLTRVPHLRPLLRASKPLRRRSIATLATPWSKSSRTFAKLWLSWKAAPKLSSTN
jgi:hypothetical protein